MGAPVSSVHINGAGNNLNINSTDASDTVTIPAPTDPSWTYSLNGSGVSESGSNGRWGASGGPNKVLSGVGSWTLSATHSTKAASCSWDNASSVVTYTDSSTSASIRTDITTAGGGF